MLSALLFMFLVALFSLGCIP